MSKYQKTAQLTKNQLLNTTNYPTIMHQSMSTTEKTMSNPLHTQQFTTEAAMSAAFYTWAHNTYLHLHGLLFHVPNEIPRAKGETKTDHMRRIQHLKAQGLVSGVPDYVYMGEPAKNKPAMLIELKLPNGTVSPEQKRIHQTYHDAGLEIHVVRTFAEWEQLILQIVA